MVFIERISNVEHTFMKLYFKLIFRTGVLQK